MIGFELVLTASLLQAQAATLTLLAGPAGVARAITARSRGNGNRGNGNGGKGTGTRHKGDHAGDDEIRGLPHLRHQLHPHNCPTKVESIGQGGAQSLSAPSLPSAKVLVDQVQSRRAADAVARAAMANECHNKEQHLNSEPADGDNKPSPKRS